jgi:hypothetical protein
MDFGGFHGILRFNDKTGSIHALKHYTKRNIEAPSANNLRKRVILRYDESCDINVIVARSMLDPESLAPEQPPQYLDLSEYPDFETMQNRVAEAHSLFEQGVWKAPAES